MHIKQWIYCGLFVGAAMAMGVQLEAQTFSAQITGSATWQKGASTVTWSYSGNPPAAVAQYGVKVVAVVMAGANMNYVLTPQLVAISARQVSVATNFTYTQNTNLQIVLEDMSGNRISPPYNVTFKAPVGTMPAPVAQVNPALATAACSYVFGQGCTGSYAQFGTYLLSNAQMFPTQAAMQGYLMNFVGTSAGAKTDIVTRAAGSGACTNAVNALSGAFTANPANPQGNGLWNSYAQLSSMAPGAVRSMCATAAPAAAVTFPQLTSALNAAFMKLALQAPTAAQSSALASVTSASAMEPAVRGYIPRDSALQGQIVANTYRQVFGGGAPGALIQGQILSQFGVRWTAADDLAAFLNANRSSYAIAPSLTVKSFLLISGLGSRCLAAQNGSAAQGTRLVLWACNASAPEQQFTFMGDGSIRPFGNQYGNLCLDILDAARDGRTMVSGDHPQVFACNGQQNQKFNFSNGTIQTPNGWCFDLWGGAATSFLSGAIDVQLYHCNAGAGNQRFVAGVALPAGLSRSPIPPDVQTGISAPSASLTSNNGVAGIVAQGGGNIVAQGGGNIVAQGGGNIVAQGGGNITSAGGGGMVIVPVATGIVAQGGGN